MGAFAVTALLDGAVQGDGPHPIYGMDQTAEAVQAHAAANFLPVTANHSVFSVQRPDWHARFDMDKDRAAATRRRVLDLATTERIPVTGYDMPFPAVGFIDKAGEEYRWVAASYQLNL